MNDEPSPGELELGAADVGLSSRRIKYDEAARLARLGDLRSAACEHVIALDGIAVIVNRANPVGVLSQDDLANIFAGQITDWSQVPNAGSGPITVLARDDKSGSDDTFRHIVLDKTPVAASAKRYEDSSKLSDDVAANVGAVGFVALPQVRSAKAVAVADGSARPVLPTLLTVRTETYVLSRRLYLYTAATPRTPLALEFAIFADSARARRSSRSPASSGRS